MALREALIRPLTADEWREASPGFLDLNYRQSWAFSSLAAARVRARSERLAVLDGTRLLAIAEVRVRSLPLLGGIAYVNGGPLCRRGKDDDLTRLSAALLALKREFVDRRGLLLRAMAPLGDSSWNEAAAAEFLAAGFRDAPESGVYRTIRIDISPAPEEIRAGFAQKWRNGLNRAERGALEVRKGEEIGLLEDFCALYASFRLRKGFAVDLDAPFYLDVQRVHLAAERFTVTLALAEGEIVAGHVASHLGNTSVYLLGATNEVGLKTQAAYLLQWQAILEAKRRGAVAYDLGGIDPEGNPGVYHFKKGMGGVEVRAAGAFECAPPGLWGGWPRHGERLYRRLRALRSGGSP